VTGPSWLADLLAAAMVATALYCSGRVGVWLVARRVTGSGADLIHASMAMAMAVMLIAPTVLTGSSALEVGFGAGAAWFALQWAFGLGRIGLPSCPAGQCMEHFAGCAAMLYMLSGPTSAAMMPLAQSPGPVAGLSVSSVSDVKLAGAGMGGFPLPAVLLAMVMFGYAVWNTGQLVLPRVAGGQWAPVVSPVSPPGLPHGAAGSRVAPIAPRLALACQVTMSGVMGYMLVAMAFS